MSNWLPHWESIFGMFSVIDGEILRFVLHNKISLERLVRHELASRGYDKNHRYFGFAKSHEIWLEGEI